MEVLWRYARALYKMSKEAPNEKERQRLIIEGYDLAHKALKKGANISTVHKWYSILLDAKSHFEGIKARIIVTEKVKHHMLVSSSYNVFIKINIQINIFLKYLQKAVELDPKDATTLYMLGLW